jgi:diguanylate cyclase (GGDEF)-like protein
MSVQRGRVDAWLSARSPRQVVALAGLLVAVVGSIDHLTGYELGFSVFYLLPVAVGTWYAGRRVGLGLSLASAATWLLVDYTTGHPYTHAAIPYWNAVVRLGFFVTVTQLLVSLRTALQLQESLAQFDGLTGVLNGRTFRERYRQLAALAERDGRVMALAYIDLDGFKAVNDSMGHATGDLVLQQVGSLLQRQLRHTDLVGRMGGDEFAVLLPLTGHDDALAVMQAACKALTELAETRSWPIGFSVGVAVLPPPAPADADAFGFADALMYRVKKSGGNRVLVESLPAGAASAPQRAAPGIPRTPRPDAPAAAR